MPMKETDVPILSDSKPLTVGLPPSEPVVKSATNGTEPMSRRQAMQWVMAAVAASALPRQGFAQAKPESENKSVAKQESAGKQPSPATQGLEGKGYGLDADLKKNYQPGDLWPLKA